MNKLKINKLSDKGEFVAQVGSLLFSAILTTVQIVRTAKGDDEKLFPEPVK